MPYITGWTTSLDFPVTADAYMKVYPGQYCCDFCGCSAALGGKLLPSAFIAKFDPQASGAASLLYSTFLGGSLGTIGYGLAVDSLGNAYVTGSTGAYYGGIAGQVVPFPTTPGAYQTVPDNNDAFVTKCNAAGNNLVYSTLLGGSGGSDVQQSTGIALDTSNDAYVTGWTNANNFPPAGNALLPNDPNPAWAQGFVTQFNSTGTQLLYSSYLGGTMGATNGVGGIAVDQVGDAYVTGSTYAIDFPITSFIFQPLYAGNGDAFVTKFPIGASQGISISGIVPNAGGNAGQVTPEIVGTGFHLGATTQLNCGSSQVPGSNVTVTANGQILTATFDLTSSSPGMCDVVVTNPDHTSATLSHGFTILQGGVGNIRISKTGTLAIKGDNPPINVTFVFALSNVGTIDAPVALWEDLDNRFTLTAVNPPAVNDPNNLASYGVVIWTGTVLAPGEKKTFSYSASVDFSTQIGTKLYGSPGCSSPDHPDRDEQFDRCLAGCDSTFYKCDPKVTAECKTAADDCQTALTDCNQDQNSSKCKAEKEQCYKETLNCCNDSKKCISKDDYDHCQSNPDNFCSMRRLWSSNDAMRRLDSEQLVRDVNTGFRSRRKAAPDDQGIQCVVDQEGNCIVCTEPLDPDASDPNYLAGPTGIGVPNWILGTVGLPYAITFTNDQKSEAAAQVVVVTQPLDRNVDASRLGLTFVSVPDLSNPGVTLSVPSGSFNPRVGINEFQTNFDLRPVQNLFVTLDATFNPQTNTVTWSFNSIDPQTGLPPTDPRIGMLPPGASGAVAFSAYAMSGLSTGTQLSDQASVVFNKNNPVLTNLWTNTIDNTPPVSQVTALPQVETCPNFTVQWSGTDVGAGVQDYTIYASDNGGQFTAWLTNTTSTSSVYNGQLGHTYSFYSIARDLVGNVEPPKQGGEANTTVSNKPNFCGPIGPPTINNQRK